MAEPASRGDLRILEVSDFRLTMYRQMFYHKDKCCTREMDAFIQLASGPDLPLYNTDNIESSRPPDGKPPGGLLC